MKKSKSLLPVQPDPPFCGNCWALPGQTHNLYCARVSLEQLQAELDRVRAEDGRFDRLDRRLSLAARYVAIVALLLVVALIWELL